jgi:hypothetical protein
MNPIRRALLVASLAVLPIAAEPLKPEQLTKIQALIRPTADEDKWDRIPWQTSLWEARKQAAAQGKPILLWEMDGHPLGCT